MRRIILILANLTWNVFFLYGQNTQNVTLGFTPSANGYIVSVPVLFKFIVVDGEVWLSVIRGGNINSSQYIYNGKTYTSSELIGQPQFSNLSSKLYRYHVTAQLFYGNNFLGSIRLPDIALSPGNSYNVFKDLGLNSRDYKDKTGSLSLRNISISIGVSSDNNIESIIRQKTEKPAPTASSSASSNTSSQKTSGNSSSSSSYSSSQKSQSYSQSTTNYSSTNKSSGGKAQGEPLYGTPAKNTGTTSQYQNSEQQKRQEEQYQKSIQAEQKRQQLISEISRMEQQDKIYEQNLNQAAAQVTNMITSAIISNQASQQAAREREELERLKREEERLQKEEEERRAEEARRIENERIALLAEYYDKGIPEIKKPSQYADTSMKEIFYLYVARTNQTTLYFSNPFPVRRLSDNTWPYVSDINNKFKAENKVSDFKIVGYYNNYDHALTKARELVRSAADSGYEVKEFSFKYKDYKSIPETANKPAQPKKSSGSDFWNK